MYNCHEIHQLKLGEPHVARELRNGYHRCRPTVAITIFFKGGDITLYCLYHSVTAVGEDTQSTNLASWAEPEGTDSSPRCILGIMFNMTRTLGLCRVRTERSNSTTDTKLLDRQLQHCLQLVRSNIQKSNTWRVNLLKQACKLIKKFTKWIYCKLCVYIGSQWPTIHKCHMHNTLLVMRICDIILKVWSDLKTLGVTSQLLVLWEPTH